jgi:hypothetical protein
MLFIVMQMFAIEAFKSFYTCQSTMDNIKSHAKKEISIIFYIIFFAIIIN